ncbi:A disintegrin and metalloproteinase with thrombospondin motifs like [Haemaphysalis longicornis]
MGHLLGAPHDGPGKHKRSGCPIYGAIMAPEVEGSSGHRFSECAEEAIRDHLEGMNDYVYFNCICVRNPVQDFLEVQKHLAPPDFNTDDFCKATEGANHYYSELENCIVHCYHGGFWSGYPGLHYPAPYGFRCGKKKICMYGHCVPCSSYKPMWKDCEKV